MENRSTTCTYSPLDESERQIRLLHLLPAVRSSNSANQGQENLTTTHVDDIHCTFSVVFLNDHVEYEALSYVWGDANDRTTIYIHGHPCKITRNLYAALLHMRQAEERILWVDALCINQADMDERASQVRYMGSVFARACTVVVYLGDWEDSSVAFRLIAGIEDAPDDAISTQEALHFKNCLQGLFSFPWWSRVWTVQEYALARTVIFQSGKHVLHGTSVEKGLREIFSRSLRDIRCGARSHSLELGRHLDEYENITNFGRSELGRHLNEYENIANVRDTISRQDRCDARMILGLRFRKCSNPLDKIYGLLALTPEPFQKMVQPNYNISHEELYTNATLAWIRSSGSLDILSYMERRTFPNSGLPSYVPDFEADVTHSLKESALLTRLSALTLFDASEGFVEHTAALPSLQVLTKAIFVDTVLQAVTRETYPQWINRLPDTMSTKPESLLSSYTMLAPGFLDTPFWPLVYIYQYKFDTSPFNEFLYAFPAGLLILHLLLLFMSEMLTLYAPHSNPRPAVPISQKGMWPTQGLVSSLTTCLSVVRLPIVVFSVFAIYLTKLR
jgi:hypothetical protein